VSDITDYKLKETRTKHQLTFAIETCLLNMTIFYTLITNFSALIIIYS